MKFDYVIGNPPYQDEAVGDQKTKMAPLYHRFLDVAYEIGDRVMMVHPGRFLFGAGQTPDEWNQKMLSDPHIRIVSYVMDGNTLFKDTDIKGGVVVTYRDIDQELGPIGQFFVFDELKSICGKVVSVGFDSLSDIIYTQTKFNLDALYADFPDLVNVIGSDGKDRRFRNNAFDKLHVFKDESFDGSICVQGLVDGKRVVKYISLKYVDQDDVYLMKYKVFVPGANGSGALGEVLSTPMIGNPMIGNTQTYITVGAFDTESEAQACLKYVKTKFARAMLGILKVTQHNPPEKWKYVPLQDFTGQSDIDWSQDVAGIDRQLYVKYGLDDDEIKFIEEKVRAM